ncbi:hypothetical protein O1611_g7634 [Lasiodiplodia mahajangana]|uniref:Uncharacterized protein n=1 Tax=Lasiodiplodia mahajangana TaxID=1108764 RepID=A0ACC2JEV2_9PEZI|nr:hypothetical protein O1611_g7634 [Lasiodiplodia mahajangana]
MLSKLIVAFPLVILALIGIAIYVQYASSTLLLPISTGITVLTILLPLFAAANIIYTPILNRLVRSRAILQLLLPALHVLQGVLTVVIATLAAQGFADGRTLKCGLELSWQRWWQNHDGRSIERVQNALECCGFNSVVDRTWPREQCEEIYGRHTSCAAPWHASMQRTSALQFAVAVLAGIMQLAYLAYLKQQENSNKAAQDFKRFPHDSERLIEEEYHDSDDEADSVDESPSNSASPATQDEAPHRVEPSGLGRDEANEWRS